MPDSGVESTEGHSPQIELRVGKKLAFVGPALGIFASEEGLRYGYAGIYADFGYKRFVLMPLLAAIVYRTIAVGF